MTPIMNDEIFPDYDYASKMAWKTLINAGIKEFPFSLIDLYKTFPRIKLRSYKQYAKELRETYSDNTITAEDIGLMVESNDGATQHLLKSTKYNVLYDSDCSHLSVQRIRFTLAHELGHYVLRHFFNNDSGQFERNGFEIDPDDQKQQAMEQEANRFARELLAPMFLLKKTPNSDNQEISRYLDISPSSAQNIINYFNDHINELHLDENEMYYKYFSNVSLKSRWNKNMPNNHYFPVDETFLFCSNCLHLQESMPNQRVCMLCGSSTLFTVNSDTFFEFHEYYEESASQHLYKIQSHKQYIPDSCPWCNKFIIDPEERICSHCGAPIRNQCVPVKALKSMRSWKDWGKIISEPLEHKHGHLLPFFAKFCPYCGSKTSYSFLSDLREYTTSKTS